MARIRAIKPEFFDDPKVGQLSFAARLFFIGLWTQADRDGRLEYDPLRLKVRIFPYDTKINIEALTGELLALNMVRHFSCKGKTGLEIPNFARHQKPHPKEAPSELEPESYTDSREITRLAVANSGEPGGSGSGSGSGSGNGDCQPSAGSPTAPLMDLWNELTVPPLPKCLTLTPKRKTHIKARMAERSLDDWRMVVSKIAASDFCRGLTGRGWVASFDWLIASPDAAVKVLEGRYDNRAAPEPAYEFVKPRLEPLS